MRYHLSSPQYDFNSLPCVRFDVTIPRPSKPKTERAPTRQTNTWVAARPGRPTAPVTGPDQRDRKESAGTGAPHWAKVQPRAAERSGIAAHDRPDPSPQRHYTEA
jgi:hypothetical protein